MTGDVADVASRRELLFVNQPFANHNGGEVVFGPDGMLYIGLGDGGSGGDPMNNGQNTATLLGKILRINPTRERTTGPYSMPADNPFVVDAGRAARDLGVGPAQPVAVLVRPRDRRPLDRRRRPERVGGDRLREGGAGGVNFGWSQREGTAQVQGRPAGGRGRPGVRVLARRRRRRGDRRLRVPRHAHPRPRRRRTCSPTTRGQHHRARTARRARHRRIASSTPASRPGSRASAQDNAGELYVLDLVGEALAHRPGLSHALLDATRRCSTMRPATRARQRVGQHARRPRPSPG